MTDSENIPQSDPQLVASNEVAGPSIVPATLAARDTSAASSLDAHQYPPTFLASELPPSPEQLAQQLGLSKIPPDLRVPWGWKDVGVFILVYLGSTILLGTIAALAAARIQHLDLKALTKTPTNLYIGLTILAQTGASVIAMLYFFLLVRMRHAGNFWSTLGWRPLNGDHTEFGTVVKYLLGGVALAAAASASSLFVKQTGHTPIEEMFKARETVLMLMAFGILAAPLIEETIFRGFIYPVAARNFGIVPGVLFTGILFGASHVSNLGGALGQIAVLVGVGIVLTWVRARTGSVLASFLLHIAYNSTLFAASFIGTHGFRDFPTGK
jgi:membrane protease YdiL (CAAX protease family)